MDDVISHTFPNLLSTKLNLQSGKFLINIGRSSFMLGFDSMPFLRDEATSFKSVMLPTLDTCLGEWQNFDLKIDVIAE